MDVLLLSWALRDERWSPRTAGLACGLAASGATVMIVTRSSVGPDVGDGPCGAAVHGVTDTRPPVPDELDDPHLRTLGFASAALATITRLVVERPVDLTVALGPGAAEVAMRLPRHAGVVVVDGDHTGVDLPPTVAVDRPTAARGGDGGPTFVRTSPVAGVRDTTSSVVRSTLVLPAAAGERDRRPGPPPRAGPVRLVAGGPHRAAAARLRASLASMGCRRRITASDRSRPAVVVVLEPTATDHVLTAAADGVPVVAIDGPAGDAVRALRCGEVVEDEHAAALPCGRLLRDRDAAVRFGAAGVAASDRARTAAAEVLLGLVARPTGDLACRTRRSAAQRDRS